jgi:hypothetical protein
MKTVIVVLFVLMTTSVIAQNGGGRRAGMARQSAEELTSNMHKVFDSVYHFDAAKQGRIDSVFLGFYQGQQKLFAEIREQFQNAGVAPSEEAKESRKTKMQELAVERDEKLQGILTETEYKRWKDEVEPASRRKRAADSGAGRAKERKRGKEN